MRIVIDIYPCLSASKFRGIGRYCSNFLLSLIHLVPENIEIILLGNANIEEKDFFLRKINTLGSKKVQFKSYFLPPLPKGNNNSQVSDKTYKAMSTFYSQLRPSLVLVLSPFEGYREQYEYFWPQKNEIPVWAIFYDLIPFLFPDQYLEESDYKAFYYNRLESLKLFDHFLSISENSTNDLIEHLKIPRERVTTIYAGLNSDLNKSSPINNHHPFNGNPYILFGGNMEYRKNLSNFLKAFAQLPSSINKEYKIVVTSIDPNDSYFRQKLKINNIESDQVISPGYVKDDYLYILYKHCDLFIMPSLYEGFGLPVIEALSADAEVIHSNNSSLSELIQNPNFTFDPMDSLDISQKIQNVILKGEKLKPSERSRIIRKFNWENVVSTFFDSLRRAKQEKVEYNKMIEDKIDSAFLKSELWFRTVCFNIFSSEVPRVIIDCSRLCKN